MHIYVYLSCFFRNNRVRTSLSLLLCRFLSSQSLENAVLLRSLGLRFSFVRLDIRKIIPNDLQSIHYFNRRNARLQHRESWVWHRFQAYLSHARQRLPSAYD